MRGPAANLGWAVAHHLGVCVCVCVCARARERVCTRERNLAVLAAVRSVEA